MSKSSSSTSTSKLSKIKKAVSSSINGEKMNSNKNTSENSENSENSEELHNNNNTITAKNSTGKPLKVLVIGNNPNVVLYCWRFAQAKTIDLSYVGNELIDQNVDILFHPDGNSDGDVLHKFDTTSVNKYPNMEVFISTIQKTQSSSNTPFDIVIIGSDSLQDLSYVSSKLAYQLVISNATKIFVESSGFINLENFVSYSLPPAPLSPTSSNDQTNETKTSSMSAKVLSIITECDFRKIGENSFEKFGNTDTLYIGISSTASTETQYSKEASQIIKTLAKLFNKLFYNLTSFRVTTCSLNPHGFALKQWEIATPMIIFDSLLILFGIENPKDLNEQILTKPLISGLLLELQKIILKSTTITSLKAPSSSVPISTSVSSTSSTSSSSSSSPPPPQSTTTKSARLDDEEILMEKWLHQYSNKICPKLLYNFKTKRNSLNIDLLLLQPILIADDYNIKTPYLEFLYSMMIQFDKINYNNSTWFINKNDYQENLDVLQKKIYSLENRQHLELDQLLNQKELIQEQAKNLERENNKLKSQVENLSNENSSMKLQLKDQIENLHGQLNSVSLEKINLIKENKELNDSLNSFNQTNIVSKNSFAEKGSISNSNSNNDLPMGPQTSTPSRNASTPINGEFNGTVKSKRIQSGTDSELFVDARSTVENGMMSGDEEAMNEIKDFTSYGIFYGTPQKSVNVSSTEPSVVNSSETATAAAAAAAIATNTASTTTTAATSNSGKLNTSTAATLNNGDDEDLSTDNHDATLDLDEEEIKDPHLRAIREKELELQKRELLLQQREKALSSGNVIQYGGPQFPVKQNMFPMPPPQQFPPMPRKPSLSNLQPGAPQHAGNVPGQAPEQRNLSGGKNSNNTNFPQQQQQQQQMYIPQPQHHHHLQQQPHLNGLNHTATPPPSGQMPQPQRVSSAPQVYHPQYIKTSRKNRTSTAILPSASKLDITGAPPQMNTMHSAHQQGNASPMPMQTNGTFGNGKYGSLQQMSGKNMRQGSITTTSTSFNLNPSVLGPNSATPTNSGKHHYPVGPSSRNVSGNSTAVRNVSSSTELHSYGIANGAANGAANGIANNLKNANGAFSQGIKGASVTSPGAHTDNAVDGQAPAPTGNTASQFTRVEIKPPSQPVVEDKAQEANVHNVPQSSSDAPQPPAIPHAADISTDSANSGEEPSDTVGDLPVEQEDGKKAKKQKKKFSKFFGKSSK